MLELGYTQEALLERVVSGDGDPLWGSFRLGFHPLVDSKPIIGIRYSPTGKFEREQTALQLGLELNSLTPAARASSAHSFSTSFRSLEINSLLLPSSSAQAVDQLRGPYRREIAESYLYQPPPWDRSTEIQNRTVRELQLELKTIPAVARPLPLLKAQLVSLLYQHKVDRELLRPKVAEGHLSLSFITEDPLLSDLLSLLFGEGSLGLAAWSGTSRDLFIYDGRDLPQETKGFIESVREAVADDLSEAKPLIDRIHGRGKIYGLEAVPVYRSVSNSHPYGYRISYSPSGRNSVAILRLISRRELESLAAGGKLDRSGDELQPKGIDFSQNLI